MTITFEQAAAYVASKEAEWGLQAAPAVRTYICDDQGRPAEAGTGLIAVVTPNNEWIVWNDPECGVYGEC